MLFTKTLRAHSSVDWPAPWLVPRNTVQSCAGHVKEPSDVSWKAKSAVPHILLVTPAPSNANTGNRVSARRWAEMLRAAGHSVRISPRFVAGNWDLLIALHARKSATAVAEFRRHGDCPTIVVLTGTDLYRDLPTDKQAQRTVDVADRLVTLQSHARAKLAARFQAKCVVIVQSATPPRIKPTALKNCFEVCVSGHLRSVKDPFCAVMAARILPANSRVRVSHLGAAMTPAMGARARAEAQRNKRYRWYGPVTRWRAKQILARSRVLVVSSKMEGGPNVISEAIVAGVPVLGTRIEGVVGLLGEDYPGYFEVGATRQLAALLERCEFDRQFYRQLKQFGRDKASAFRPTCEAAAWNRLVDDVTKVPAPHRSREP